MYYVATTSFWTHEPMWFLRFETLDAAQEWYRQFLAQPGVDAVTTLSSDVRTHWYVYPPAPLREWRQRYTLRYIDSHTITCAPSLSAVRAARAFARARLGM